MPYPDALKGNPKVIFFTDFDGTITLQDTNDTLTDNLGIGEAERRRGNGEVLHGRMTFRQLFAAMMTPIRATHEECVRYLLARVSLDPHFADFLTWAEGAGVPVVILSSGLVPIIRAVLEHHLGAERARRIEIVANGLVLDEAEPHDAWSTTGAGWGIKFKDETDFGHDKSRAIRPYARHVADEAAAAKGGRRKTVLLYAGDGVSDLSAARETDLLFAKKGRDLVTYCEQENVPFTVFEDWSSILAKTKELYEGNKDVDNLAEEGRKEAEANSSTK